MKVAKSKPHGTNFWKPQRELPVPDRRTEYTSYELQCFWLDKKYIRAIVEGRDGEYLMEALGRMESDGNIIDYEL